MPKIGSPTKERLLLILFALLAGIIFNYLFYGKTLGISYPLYVLVLLGLFWWGTRKFLAVGKSFGWFVLIPLFLLAGAFAVYSNPVLEVLNFMLIPLLLVVHSLLVTNSSPAWSELSIIGDIVKRVLPFTIENFPKPFLFIAEEIKPKERGSFYETGKKIVIGLLISVPLLLIVLPLLSSADMVFNNYLINLSKIWDLDNFMPIFNQGLIILFVFLCVFGFILSFHTKHPGTGIEKAYKQFAWDSTILLTVLFVINLVYLIFSIIQFSYLYGGQTHSLPADFSYADYARRGFFELVAVTVLNLGILLCSMKFFKSDNKIVNIVVQGFLSLLVVFSLNLLFSAHFKMSLYVEAYGLTYLRIFVHYFMGLLLVLFLIALGSIWLRKVPLVKAYIVITLIFYTVLNFINVDRIIARNNIDRYFRIGEVDLNCLQNLSYDAIPEMVRLQEDNNREIAGQVKEYLSKEKQDLSKDKPWQSFNYSRYKAKSTLEKYTGEN